MRKELLNFIVNRLKDKNIEIKSHTIKIIERVKNDGWLMFSLIDTDGNKHTVCVMRDDDEIIKKWFKLWAFDSSMSKKDKEKIIAETPMREELSTRYQQQFMIDNQNYYFKYTTYK